MSYDYESMSFTQATETIGRIAKGDASFYCQGVRCTYIFDSKDMIFARTTDYENARRNAAKYKK